jgi:hypothetical protein
MPGGAEMGQLGSALVGAGAIGGVLGFFRWLMTRHSDAVTEFRKALDRGLRRENGLLVCCELLVYAIDHLEAPPAQILELRTRAADVLEQTQRQIYGGDK